MNIPVYLDFNATTPCDPRVLEAMLPYFTEKFGNAASRHHWYGWQAEEAVKQARERLAGLIGAETNELTFTSGATESCNLAIKGIYEAYGSKGNHIITTNIEHKAVLDTCKYLEKQGAEVSYLPVNESGLISPDQIAAVIKDSTILICVMYANNEVGTIMPIREIGELAKERKVIFFSDATQAIGKIPVDVNRDNIDALALSGHKFYGPKGAGALYSRRKNPRVRLTAQIHGGGHENNIRSGTLNVPAIVGLGTAAAIAEQEMQQDAVRLSSLRDQLETSLLEIEESSVNGSTMHRLPQITNMAFKYIDSDAVMTGLKRDVALSSGSACTSAVIEPSYVLKALGLNDDLAHGSLRFGLGKFTTEEEIGFVINMLKSKIAELREISPVWKMYKQGIHS